LVPAVAAQSPGELARQVTGKVQPDGRFVLKGVSPGRYRLVAASDGGWNVQAAFIHGEDTPGLPGAIKPGARVEGAKSVLADTHTELSGSVTDSRYAARPLTVVVFASDHRFWTPSSRRVLATPVSTDGHYSFTDIPPGEYRVAATLALDQDTLLGDAGILT